MNKWIDDFLICLIMAASVALVFVVTQGQNVFTKENFFIIWGVILILIMFYAVGLCFGAHFYTTFRQKIGTVRFIGALVIIVMIMMFLTYRCSP